ncbi:MAG: hypothetical protein HY471_01680 [Candidatus Sungbacteria bacterium]|nr:hypothetical protein [Candidatus Sungbacteria bacterium]
MCTYSLSAKAVTHQAREGEHLLVADNPQHTNLGIFMGTTPDGAPEIACVLDGATLTILGRQLTGIPERDRNVELITAEAATFRHTSSKDWFEFPDGTVLGLHQVKSWKFTVPVPTTPATTRRQTGGRRFGLVGAGR